jgi:hypothetical protein
MSKLHGIWSEMSENLWRRPTFNVIFSSFRAEFGVGRIG